MSAPAGPAGASQFGPDCPPGSCPGEEALEAHAVGAGEDEAVRAHVQACVVCRERVEEIRENNRFLAHVRSVEQPDSDAAPGADLIPGYQILGEIHRGGQGVVYKAVQNETRRKVAVKVLLHAHLTSTRQRLRFEQEIALAASLRHPNIVLVFDSVRPRDGRLGYAMEYVRGRPLDDWAAGIGGSSAPGIEDKVRLFIKVCGAVNYAHRRGIIHRDLKPGNILVDADGEPRLCDFGVAKIIAGDAPPTVTGEFVGTLAYASPEQVTLSPDQIDTRSDGYALGVLLYEVLTGVLPYAIDGPMGDIIRNITSAEPRRPAEVGVRLRSDLETILFRALAKEPDRRYQTAQALADDLQRYLSGEAIEARRSSGWYVLRKSARRHWPALAVAAGFVLLVAGFGVYSRVQADRLADNLSLSRVERARGLVQLGNVAEAERLLWTELLCGPQRVANWDPRDEALPASRAWWALWELYAAHPCRRSIRAAANPLNVIASAPGRPDRLLTAGVPGGMTLWSWPEMEPIAVAPVGANGSAPTLLPARPTGVRAGALLDGDLILTVDYRRRLQRWDSATLVPVGGPIDTEVTDNFNIRFSPDGRLLVLGDGERIRILLAASGEIIQEFPHDIGSDNVRCAFSPDGRLLAYAQVGRIVLRDLASGVERHVALHDAQKTESLAFSPAEPRLFVSVRGTIWSVDVASVGVVHLATVQKQARTITLGVSPDGSLVAAVGEDRRISVWPTALTPQSSGALPVEQAEPVRGIHARALAYLAGHDDTVTPMAFAPDGASILSGDFDGILKQWDLPRPDRRGAFLPLTGHASTVFGVAMSADGLRAWSGSVDGSIRAWDLATGREFAHAPGLGGSVEAVALSPDGRCLLASIDAGDEAHLLMLDPSTLSVVHTIEHVHQLRCPDVAFSPGGDRFLSVGDDGFVRLWDTGTRARLAERSVARAVAVGPTVTPVRSVRFSPGGRDVAWGGMRGVAQVSDADLRSAPRSLAGARATVRCVRFSPDGRLIAGAGDDFAVFIWDAGSGRRRRELKGHAGYVYNLDFSPDGRLLASCGGDGAVYLWDARSGDDLAILRDEHGRGAGGLFTLAFSPGGDRLLVGGADGYLGVWDLRGLEPHIAGNLDAWAARLDHEGRPSPIARAAQAWARERASVRPRP